jgi:hypothetical protein
VDADRFTQCPCCGAWFSRDDILANPAIVPIGMMRDGDDRERNLLFFNHLDGKCGSTFTIDARRLAPFLQAPEPQTSLMGGPDCQHHCTSMKDLKECASDCRWAPYRRFLLELRRRRNF